jgi:hypothetical protein
MRLFPILTGTGEDRGHVAAIPWDVIAAHDEQARLNHGQTLVRLAERGGLCASEAVAILENRDWRAMHIDDAEARLRQLIGPVIWRLRSGPTK